MSPTTRLRAATFALVILGCQTPGYYVLVKAKRFPAARHDEVVSMLERRAKERGFSAAYERREFRSSPGVFVSTYAKRMSMKSRDYTEIGIGYNRPASTLGVLVHNDLRGMEPPVKAEIDALGEMYEAELSAAMGRDNISVERGKSSLPGPY